MLKSMLWLWIFSSKLLLGIRHCLSDNSGISGLVVFKEEKLKFLDLVRKGESRFCTEGTHVKDVFCNCGS